MTIIAVYVHPPIPFPDWDWCAYDEASYEPGCPIGWGATEREAREDLYLNKMREEE